MELNSRQLNDLGEVFNVLQEKTLPFKVSLIIAKNMNIISKEMDFYIEQEQKFAQKYLEIDENGQFIQTQDNVFKIKDGMSEECRAAREELNNFTTDVELRKLPLSALESLEFTPKQLAALEIIIDEEA